MIPMYKRLLSQICATSCMPRRQCQSIVQTLIREHKVDVNARDNQNSRPLNVAAFSGKADVALSLVMQ